MTQAPLVFQHQLSRSRVWTVEAAIIFFTFCSNFRTLTPMLLPFSIPHRQVSEVPYSLKKSTVWWLAEWTPLLLSGYSVPFQLFSRGREKHNWAPSPFRGWFQQNQNAAVLSPGWEFLPIWSIYQSWPSDKTIPKYRKTSPFQAVSVWLTPWCLKTSSKIE